MATTNQKAKPPAKKAGGVRARVRAELTSEIKAAANRQMAESGASGLSLRAIARELGMASSAIYRYFASRDELLTALIIDAYNDLGDAVETAVRHEPAPELAARFLALSCALRSWALANPNQYALIYGSPIPGYAAPEDTIPAATRVPVALLVLLLEGQESEGVGAPTALTESLAGLVEFTDGTIDAHALARGVEVWAELFGLVSLELFGHFANTVSDPERFFVHAVESMAARVLR